MMQLRTPLYLMLTLLLLFGCEKAQNEAQDSTPPAVTNGNYFDLKSFVEALIEDHTARGLTVDKSITLNGNSERKEDLEVQWKTEFRPFLENHINRVAWQDKFTIDTVSLPSGDWQVAYRSTARDIPVKEVNVVFQPDSSVRSIRVLATRKNLLYNSRQDLQLEPGSRYYVNGSQRALLLSRSSFEVEGFIRSKETP